MHSASNWLLLAVFNETKKFFRITDLVFEICFFGTCRELPLIQSHFTANLLFSTILKEIFFFLKNYLFFFTKTKTWTFWENLLIQSHSTAYLLPLSLFWKIGFFFEKTHSFFKKTPHFRKFWEFLLFQWPCSVTLLLLGIFKNSRIFSNTQSIFFSKENQFLNVLRNPTKSVAFCIKLAAFSGLQKNSKFFFEKPIFVFQEEATSSTFWEILLIQLHPTTITFAFSGFWKSYFFFEKLIFFTWKNQILNILRTFIHSVARYSEFATFSNFSLKKSFCSTWTHLFFSKP